MELNNASQRKAKMTGAEKTELKNASLREDMVANEETAERGTQVTNGEQMERTRASWKEANMTYESALQDLQPGK